MCGSVGFLIVRLCEYFGLYVLHGYELIVYLLLAYLDPTQMGGLSMLLLAGEHALGTPEVSIPLSLPLSVPLLLEVDNIDTCVLFTVFILQFHC